MSDWPPLGHSRVPGKTELHLLYSDDHSLVDELGLILPDVESALLENVQDPEQTSELLSQKEISSMTMPLLGSMSRLVTNWMINLTNYLYLQINKKCQLEFSRSTPL